MSNRSQVTAGFVKTVAVPFWRKRDARRSGQKKWEEHSTFGSMESVKARSHLRDQMSGGDEVRLLVTHETKWNQTHGCNHLGLRSAMGRTSRDHNQTGWENLTMPDRACLRGMSILPITISVSLRLKVLRSKSTCRSLCDHSGAHKIAWTCDLADRILIAQWSPLLIWSHRRDWALRRGADLWNILRETCFINISHATYLQPSAYWGNIFHAICCNLSIWINEKHDNKVWNCATFPHATQWVSWNIFQETYISCFIVCAVPLKYIDLLHHTNISYFMQHDSSNLFHWCAPYLRGKLSALFVIKRNTQLVSVWK